MDLIDRYTIIKDNDEVHEHYEYRLPDGTPSGEPQVSPCARGIGMVEACASGIIGRRVGFFLLHESRFFPAGQDRAKEVRMDISIARADDGRYLIAAEVTDGSGVWMEVAGEAEERES